MEKTCSNPNTVDLLRQLVNEELNKRYPHECWTCSHFKLVGEEGKVKMRFCRYPGKIVLDEHEDCKWWVLADDVVRRKGNNFTR